MGMFEFSVDSSDMKIITVDMSEGKRRRMNFLEM